MANTQMVPSTGTPETAIPQLVHTFHTIYHIIPTFKHTLIGNGHICDADCAVTFSKCDVTVFEPDRMPILTGWCETTGAKLCRFSLLLGTTQLSMDYPDTENALLSTYSAYDIPSV